MVGRALLAILAMLVVSQSAPPAEAAPGLFKPPTLFANASSPANKTAALLAVVSAKERNIIASLGAKPNATTLAATIAAYQNLTSGAALSILPQPPASGAAAPTGTLQCLVNPDGIVAGIVGSNGAGLCASAGATSVAIPVGDGYISGLKVAVAKAGPPYVGQLGISVTPRGGGKPSTYWCGFGGGVPATLLSPLQSLALYNLKAGCVPAPQASGRRRLAASGVMDLTSIKIEVSTPPAATADAPPPALQLNSVPVSEPVAPTPTPAPLSPPSAPAITAATSPSRGLVQVTFTPPSNPGNPPLTNYTIACAPSSGSPAPACSASGAGVVTTSLSSSATQGSIGNLVGGTSYICFVLAVSSTSSVCSAASAPVTVTSAQPSAPTVGAVVSPSAGVIQVGFTPSTDLGNPEITGYTVACIAYGGGAVPACATLGAGVQAVNVALNATQGSVPGFVGGTQIVCFVVVSNGVGGNVCSAASSPVTVQSAAPSAPTISSATSTAAGTIDVAFAPSTASGNPPVTGYTIACLPFGGSSIPACATSGSGVVTTSVSSSATSGSISGLVGGSVYVCYVQANAGGGNVCSSASSSVTVQSAAPSAPVLTAATSTAAGTIDVAFTQSTSVGNPPLTGYTIACLPNASPTPACATLGAGVVTAAVSSSATSGSITGLVGGSVFVCYVQANAAGGNACSSASAAVTVTGAPATAPSLTAATSTTNGTIDVSFTAATYLGNPALASYTVACLPNASPTPACAASGSGVVTTTAAVGTTSATISNLVGGSQFVCYVISSPGVCSSASAAVTVTGAPATAPSLTAATSTTNGTIDVSFSGSAYLGNPAISTYTVSCLPYSGATPACAASGSGVVSTTAAAGTTSATISNLVGGSQFVCYVISSPGVCSSASAAVTVTGAPATAATLSAATSPSNGTINVSFTAASYLGNPALTSYTVACLPYSGTTPACAASGSGVVTTSAAVGTISASILNLVGGSQFVCYVISSPGVCSSASSPVTVLSSPPSAPALTSATSTVVGTINVAFTQSMSAGNPPLTGYTIACLPNASPTPACATSGSGIGTTTVASSATSGSVSGLVGGSAYVCYVQANASGGNTCSSASSPVTAVSPPTVIQSAANLAQNSATLTIAGSGFDTNAAGNTVTLSSGSGTVTSATATSLTVTLSTQASLGALTAIVSARGGSSGAAVQVATIVAAQQQYAYVTNNGDSTVSVCTLTGFSNVLSNCAKSGTTMSYPNSIVVSGGYAYITNSGSTTASVCGVSGSPPQLGSCATSGSFNFPDTILVQDGYAWVTNFNGNSVSICQITAQPALASCSTTGTGLNKPAGIAFWNSWALITNYNAGSVSVCQVTAGPPPSLSNCAATSVPFGNPNFMAVLGNYVFITAGNAVYVCAITGSTPPTVANCASSGSTFSSPQGITLANGLAYVSNLNSNTVSVCQVSGTPPTLSNCATSGNGLSQPVGITVGLPSVGVVPTVTQSTANLVSSATTLIINGMGFASTPAGNSVVLSSGAAATVAAATSTQLTLTLTSAPSTGTLTAVVKSWGISSGSAVQVATVVTPTYAYVINFASNTVSACTVSGATLSNCATAASGFVGPFGIAISGGVAYVTNNGDNTVTACTASGATLTNCVTASGFGSPNGIAISGGIAYVTNFASNTVTACTASGTSLTNCATAASGFNGPTAIAISGGVAYVSNYNANTVTSCTVSGATLSNCATAASGFNIPRGIAISGGLAYVVNSAQNTVVSCTVSGATLTNCATAASGFVGPFGIAISGGIAYVTNYNGNTVTSCTVSGATLTNCATAASGFVGPFGIALPP